MKVIETNLKDCYIMEPTVFEDERGYFFESFNAQKFEKLTNLKVDFVQDNQSKSTYGVLRGLHFQNPSYAQTKLVRAIQGTIMDVAVDIRKSSPTYGQYLSIELSAENKKQLLVPKGFAHGFSVLSKTAEILYKCDNYYNKDSEGGLMFNDPLLNIDWGVPENQILLSEKDRLNPYFQDFETKFD
jgi:dTDP-4-dehydrorhamnose 3,5-epimerase